MYHWPELESDLDAARRAVYYYPKLAARSADTYDMLDEAEGITHPYDKARAELGKLIAAARAACRELKALRVHACDYGDDDYCTICGRDGRS